MKLILTIAGAAAVALAAKPFVLPCDCGVDATAVDADQRTSLATDASVTPTGDYVEARNVTLWGGACHLNGEYDHQGDAALVAWSIDVGGFDGVDLSGVEVAAAMTSGTNLAEDGARTCEVFVDAATLAQKNAAVAWLRAEHSAALGAIASVDERAIAVERVGDRFRVEVDGLVELEGSAIADRSCCSMAERRGYEPLMAAAGAVVGFADVCTFEGTDAIGGWQYEGANSVFVTGFGERSGCAESAACTSTSPKP